MFSRQSQIFLLLVWRGVAFTVPTSRQGLSALSYGGTRIQHPSQSLRSTMKDGGDEEEEEEEEKSINPYADPNYPDLEFVNYDDPEYSVDQGTGDEFFDGSSDTTEQQIEEMREERRKRNDEYQFQTYFKDILLNGSSEYRGEWTIYQNSRLLSDEKGDETPATGEPQLVTATDKPLTVVSRGVKEIEGDDAEYDIDAERILHSEKTQQPSLMRDAGIAAFEATLDDEKGANTGVAEGDLVGKLYWPEELKARDFRGEQGIMVCGSAYTICTATPLNGATQDEVDPKGPYSEYRAEVGIVAEKMRFRVKLDYRTMEDATSSTTPPLHLSSLTVCREVQDAWPRTPGADDTISTSLFGPAGAAGGLYDPPPIKTEDQASKYFLMELEGCASLLFPYEMDQDPTAHDGEGWVTSLDWTAGSMRYQVDRKIGGGADLLGLKTLELSEVQGVDAERYRPRDGGENMQQ